MYVCSSESARDVPLYAPLPVDMNEMRLCVYICSIVSMCVYIQTIMKNLATYIRTRTHNT
jgi:hypothetical protein